jgi:outer membrane protein assembly factor BamA
VTVRTRAPFFSLAALFVPAAALAETAPRHYVERIEVQGNERTRADVIRNHLLFREGMIVEEEQIVLSRLRLMSLGTFYEVKIRLRRGSRPGRVVVVVQVVERNTVVVEELFIGGSARTPFWGGFGVSDHNFLGLGHWLHGAWALSGDQQAYRLDYFAPSIPGTPLLAGGGLLYTKGLEVFQIPPTRGGTSPATDVSPRVDYERFGGYLSVGYKFGGFNRFLVDYRIEGLRAFAGAGLTDPQIARGRSRLFSLTWTFERDTRDRPFVATRGHRFRLGVELGSELLGGSYNFTKYTLSLDQQLPAIRDSHSFKLDLRLGLIQGETPFFNQFFFGDTSFFSFRDRALPRALGLNFSKESIYDPVLMSAGLEYAVPLALGGRPLHRAYFFFATNATYTATLDETLGRVERPVGNAWTFSFDLGLKLDTSIGVFTFSVAYLLDFFL